MLIEYATKKFFPKKMLRELSVKGLHEKCVIDVVDVRDVGDVGDQGDVGNVGD